MSAKTYERIPIAATSLMPRIGGHGGGGGHQHAKERPRQARRTILRVWSYLSRQKSSLILAAFMVAGIVALDLTGPILVGRVIDHYIVPRDLAGLWRVLLLMAAVYASSLMLNLLQSYVMVGAAQRAIRDIRADLFGKLQRLPLDFFDRRIHGELMARLTSDVESINQVLSNSVTQIVTGILSTVGVGVAMFVINPWMAGACVLVVGGLTILSNRWLATRIYEHYRVQQSAVGHLYGYVEEVIGGQRVIKAYGQEKVTEDTFREVNHNYRDAATRAQALSSLTPPIMNTVNNIALTLVGGIGGFLAIHGLTTVGTIATFVNYTRQFGRPLNEIANLYNQLQSALAGAERVFEIIDETPEVDAPRLTEVPRFLGDVVFDDVTFSYIQGKPVLKHIHLHASAGQTIALIGPTGAGKTTIINLLTRFYELEGGKILVDGIDLRDLPKESLRRQLGIVLQDTFLFSGSIRDNIRYGRLDATDQEVLDAARLANADTFIHRMPLGYDTLLAERGSNLSHGQRQMLAIARAILANPAILILDEATSSVDTRTEKHIQQAMLRLMNGRTSFVIAHRLSTIRGADQILVINNGEIQERGTHTELLALRGIYWRLSSRQQAAASHRGENRASLLAS
ncbi:MAG: ABC transporter ATP-binding protein [Opitutaceae bacterium]|jgi:ATP-binding cassette subfamily B protein